MDIEIRKGIKEDLPDILTLIRELADYENSLDQVSVTLKQLEKDGKQYTQKGGKAVCISCTNFLALVNTTLAQ